MRKITVVLLAGYLASLFSVLALASPSHSTSPSIIKNPINFSDYKGKWVVVNYWASWCDHCISEIPELNAFYWAHRDKVAMFSVNYDDGPAAELGERIKISGVEFPTFSYDPARYYSFYVGSIFGLPTTLLIGPDGKLMHTLKGSQTKDNLERLMGL